MKPSILKKQCIKALNPIFLPLGFELKNNRIDYDYYKNTKLGYQKVSILISTHGGQLGLSMECSVCISAINTICAPYSTFDASTPTVTASLRDFGFDKDGYYTNTQQELDNMINIFVSVASQYIIPFFEKYNSINTVDFDLNKEDLHSKDVFYRPFIGITAAALNKNQKFSYWENYYREILKNTSEHRKKKYEDLISLLKEKYVGK